MRALLLSVVVLLATPRGEAQARVAAACRRVAARLLLRLTRWFRQDAASAQLPSLGDLAGAAAASIAGVGGAAALTVRNTSALLPAAHAAHASALRLRHAVARRRWKADLVVVVTWHNKSIDWLASTFPLEHTSFVLYSKGGLKRCGADVPAALAHAVVACHETHNAGGREAHTIAQFIVQYYHNLPRLTYFAQDDSADYKTAPLREVATSAAAFEAWARRAEARPFSSRETCLCDIVIEPVWSLPTYWYEYYNPMRWFMESFLGFDIAASNWTSVRWPANADVVVPATAIRGRPMEVYMVILLIFNGTSPALDYHIAPDTTLLVQMPITRTVSMLRMAHVFERLWFAVFDTRYSPRQADYDARASSAAADGAAAAQAVLNESAL